MGFQTNYEFWPAFYAALEPVQTLQSEIVNQCRLGLVQNIDNIIPLYDQFKNKVKDVSNWIDSNTEQMYSDAQTNYELRAACQQMLDEVVREAFTTIRDAQLSFEGVAV